MHGVENWGRSEWQRASESRPEEEHSKARVYSYSNLYYGSSKVLNVMRKCQPAGKIWFHTRFAIIQSGWGSRRCLTCFNGMSEERTDADLICPNKPEKPQRELPFREGLLLIFFFSFINSSFECHRQRPSAQLPLEQQGRVGPRVVSETVFVGVKGFYQLNGLCCCWTTDFTERPGGCSYSCSFT